MPGLDGTGPQGQGSMTGGGFGRCNPSGGNRQYLGSSMRRGRRNRFYRNADGMTRVGETDTFEQRNAELEAEIAATRQESRAMAEKIDAMSAMIEELKAQSKPAKTKSK